MLSTSDNLHLFTFPRKPNSAEQSTAISNYLLRIFYSMKLSFKNKRSHFRKELKTLNHRKNYKYSKDCPSSFTIRIILSQIIFMKINIFLHEHKYFFS